MLEDEYTSDRSSFLESKPIKLAIGFSAFALVAAIMITPSADDLVAQVMPAKPAPVASIDLTQVDTMTTASVPEQGVTKRYYVRRSVLQKDPSSECRIYVSGRREGAC